MKFLSTFTLFSALLLSGCAHQISLNPDNKNLNSANETSTAIVGYYISDEDLKKQVKTPGGGGDNVSYKPYKDTESALYTTLSNKFNNVFKLESLTDKKFLKDNNIKYVFVPKITTNSSSDSLFTWPPTSFTFTLNCDTLNEEGVSIKVIEVTGEGKAEFEEFKNDFSLSAKRATEEAFNMLVTELDKSKL
ncbi:hypothetical protein PULV_a0333 [Pseudoalteromonas ulvae UL12]|uniref:hypothetical protein n=1 Tax=Pseudoalteromonas ulvae TaxID=107327 RepID=UPI00186B6916|nr:hypothetical protein [Pseudoalteromonas ulvae]MBE0362770.1 hypothetical protein [Pseudoalteromonas ulvae UL12]